LAKLLAPDPSPERRSTEARIPTPRRRQSNPGNALEATVGKLVKLTPAESGVLRLIARNLTTQEIAKELGISPKTVENHRSNICRKLDVTGNNALLRFALQCVGAKIPL
jgi:DNA-binding CsgD family transcriptional regulator